MKAWQDFWLIRWHYYWFIISLAACATSTSVPVVERAQPPTEKINRHVVSKGETLYSIAWRYSMDYAQLATYNGLRAPYTIYHGQRLSLVPTAAQQKRVMSSQAVSPSVKAKVQRPTARSKPQALPKEAKTPPLAVVWQWPTEGRLDREFSNKGAAQHKGLDILGSRGQAVLAAAAGQVVYAGEGLPAYGKLLIVKHDARYLSAYAHNSRLLVNEGTNVDAGQKIAEMGNTGTQKIHLHFEIRRDGKPQNPLSLLPKRSG